MEKIHDPKAVKSAFVHVLNNTHIPNIKIGHSEACELLETAICRDTLMCLGLDYEDASHQSMKHLGTARQRVAKAVKELIRGF